jgi:hypothetical protein
VAQSTWPGCRAPHAWLARGRSTLDFYDGRRFTLVRAGADAPPAAAFEGAFGARRVPFHAVQITDPAACALYERKLVLVRPDGHVCWRGNAVPDDVERIVDTVRGA